MLEYEVVAVGLGEEAGGLSAQPEFDVLLTDLMLPEITGGRLAHGLLERWPKLKLILMSGYTEDVAARRRYRARLLPAETVRHDLARSRDPRGAGQRLALVSHR